MADDSFSFNKEPEQEQIIQKNHGPSEPDKEEKADEQQKEIIKKEKPIKHMKPESYLQLFRYDINTNTESIVQGFRKKEYSFYLCPLFNNNFGNQMIIFSKDSKINRKILECYDTAVKLVGEAHKLHIASIVIKVNSHEIVHRKGENVHDLIREAIEEGFFVSSKFQKMKFD